MKSSKPKGSALIIIIVIIVVVIIGGGLFFVLNHKNTTTAPSATTSTTPASSSSSSSSGSTVTTDQVTIKDMAFTPNNITIAKGATVTWTNNDNMVHTVTANDGSFASDSLAAGKTFSHTFNTPGSYKYHCVIHPSMTGTVTVTP
jgi:plastocyanin